jgi:AraC-like DNA-binding protein
MQAQLAPGPMVKVDHIAFWQDVVCRTLLNGDCFAPHGQKFRAEISTRPASEFTASRIRSVKQRYVRTPGHVRRTSNDTFMLLLQLSGTGLLSQDGREVLLEPGDFAFTDSTRPAGLSFDDDFDQLVVDIPRNSIAGAFGRTERLTALSGRRAVVGPVLSSFLSETASIDEVRPATAQRLSQIGLALIMTTIGEMTAIEKGSARWTRTALLFRGKEFIKARARDPALNPQMVAAALGISTRYLQAIFRDENVTPSACIWTCRLEKSRLDLSDPALAAQTIGTIALASGFSDFAHFSHRFAAAYGMSPRAFRAQHLNDLR